MNASMLRPLPAADARLRELLRTTPSRLQVLDRGAVAAAGATVALALIGRPEREVVAQQLHDERRVLVRLLRERVELRDRVVERLLREMARAVGRREHLVVEDREVEREARRLLARVRLLELGEVAVVVALHLVVEHLALLARRVRDELPLNNREDVRTDILELLLDLAAVALDEVHLVGLALLLDRADH